MTIDQSKGRPKPLTDYEIMLENAQAFYDRFPATKADIKAIIARIEELERSVIGIKK